jgi:hypothetical protein
MGIILRRNISNFSFEIYVKYGMNVGRCEHQKRKIQLLKRTKIHKSTVFLFLNRMLSYRYGPESEHE